MKLRIIGLVLAIASIVITLSTLVSSPGQDLTDTQQRALDSVLSDNKLNDANATNVNQQMVVNGWVARDLLVLNASQNRDLVGLQARTNALLQGGIVLLGLAIVGGGLGLALNARNRSVAATQTAASEGLVPPPS